jgi:hypothetical protein
MCTTMVFIEMWWSARRPSGGYVGQALAHEDYHEVPAVQPADEVDDGGQGTSLLLSAGLGLYGV